MTLNRNEILELVRRICECDYTSEEEEQSILTKIRANIPSPDISDLIYKHVPELTPEEIVEKALSYKPIITPPPRKND